MVDSWQLTVNYIEYSNEKEYIGEIKPNVKKLIKKYRVDMVGFIPPTVKREVQLMKELENNLDFKIGKINITKIKTPITVP